MLLYARTGLTKAVVTGPGRAVLFNGRHSLGEGLSLDESRDATFVLTGQADRLLNQPILPQTP